MEKEKEMFSNWKLTVFALHFMTTTQLKMQFWNWNQLNFFFSLFSFEKKSGHSRFSLVCASREKYNHGKWWWNDERKRERERRRHRKVWNFFIEMHSVYTFRYQRESFHSLIYCVFTVNVNFLTLRKKNSRFYFVAICMQEKRNKSQRQTNFIWPPTSINRHIQNANNKL